MVNPKSGHTAANITLGVDGLRDGDVITSPSLTNLLEGLHGNGIIRLQDGARAQANRNEVMTNAPGHCVRATASTLTVHGGYAVLDGCLYAFAGGAGASVTLTLENTQNYVSSTALSSGEEVLYVIYLVGNSNAARSSSRVRVLGGTPTTTTTGVFPPVPDGFLTDPITGLAEANSQTIVLAVVRAIYKSSGGGNDNIDIVEVNDKRTFIHNTPHYFTPLTTASTTANATTVVRSNDKGINTDVQLKNLEFGADEQGDFGTAIGGNRIDVSALWVSHQNWKASIADATDPALPSSSDPNYGLGPGGGYDSTTATYADAQTPTDVLYFSGQGNAKQSLAAGGAMTTVRVGSKGVDKFQLTVSGNKAWPVTSYGDQVFITDCTTAPSGSNFVTYTPDGEFPEGHMIWIQNTNGAHDNIRFNGTGISNQVIESGKTAQYVYDGTTWYRLSYV
tara:strand:+ start:4069 stop:5415 length:1347 start_codon:yes stop_codon:yes gene_type:complete